MVKFETITHIHQVPQAKGWVEVSHFNSKNRIVNAKGEEVGKDYTGHKFVLLKKQEHYFSIWERLIRGCLGTLKLFPSLLGCIEFKSVQELFKKKKLTKRFGIPDKTSDKTIESLKDNHLDKASSKKELGSENLVQSQDVPNQINLNKEKDIPSSNHSIEKKDISNAQDSIKKEDISNAQDSIDEKLELNDENVELKIERKIKLDTEQDIKQKSQPPSLPFLLNLEVSMDSFLNGHIDERIYNGKNIRLDRELMTIPLKNLINRNELSISEKAILEDPLRESTIKCIDNKIKALNEDKHIQLKERLPHLENHHVLNIWELYLPWNLSPLKYLLMMDEELGQLKLKDIQSQDPWIIVEAFIEKELISRLIKLNEAKQTRIDPSQFSKDTIEESLLRDLCIFKADKINELAEYLPPSAFCFISETEIPSINLKVLSERQIEFLLSRNNIKKISTEQLNDCIDKLDSRLLDRLFYHLDDQQLMQLNYDNQSIFDKIFGTISLYSFKHEETIQKMELPKLYEVCPYFSISHWKVIPADRLAQFDYSKIGKTISIDKTQFGKIFNEIFSVFNTTTVEIFDQMELSNIYNLMEYFSVDETTNHWQLIPAKHLLNFNYSLINRSIFDLIFYYDKKIDQVFPSLSTSQIEEMRSLFSRFHWRKLSKEQLQKLDYSKFDQESVDDLLDSPFYLQIKLFLVISDDQLIKIKPYLLNCKHFKDYLHMLSPEQKKLLGIAT